MVDSGIQIIDQKLQKAEKARIHDKNEQRIDNKVFKSDDKFTSKIDRLAAFLMEGENPDLEKKDDNESLVSVEESERRIAIILISLSLFLCLIASVFLHFTIKLKSKSTIIIHLNYTESQMKHSNPLGRMRLSLMDVEGQIMDFKMQNFHLEKSWTLQLPKISVGLTSTAGNYFAVSDKKKIFIIYGDMKKDITTIDSNRKHRTLRGTKTPIECGKETLIVRINSFVWLFGGGKISETSGNAFKSILWSIKRQKWMKAPVFPTEIQIAGGCALAKNREVVQIFAPYYEDFDLDIFELSYNFALDQWNFVGDPAKFFISTEMTCVNSFDKSGKA